MAGEEDQPQHVVVDVVDERVEVGHVHLLPLLQGVAELRRTTAQGVGAPELVDGATLRGLHQPGGGVVGDARGGPLLERGHQGVLGEVLGEREVSGHPGEGADEPGRLVAPHPLDRVLSGLGGPALAHMRRLGGTADPGQEPVGASSGSAIRRISIEPSHVGQCSRWMSAIFWPSARASSSESTLMIAQPPMTSLASV